MRSQPMTILRINKLGKPYVQSSDPSKTRTMLQNDIWLDPVSGTMKTWNGAAWEEMQFGGSAIMDDCIANRMLANDISASKITAGVLQSQDGSFYLNLETGEAQLLRLIMGGQVEGNIIATSSNGLTRVRLRGREGEKDITAGLIYEERESIDTDEWNNAGQIYFAYTSRQTYSAIQNYQIGKYNSSRPTQGYNGGARDGLMWRSVSTDWLRASYLTYHGLRLAKKNSLSENFENVPPVMQAIGDCLRGETAASMGSYTCTYELNEIMRIDFSLRITTAGTGSEKCGISTALLRSLNVDIPSMTPVSGGTYRLYNSNGNLLGAFIGASFVAENDLWVPSYVTSGELAPIAESVLSASTTITGTLYGKYTLEDD